MNIINLIMKSFALEAARFELKTKNPAKAQETVLFNILRKNKDTAFGKKYNFSSIKSIKDFQQKVPVNTYETLLPFIRRMLRKEKNILIKDKPLYFGITSGTTNRPKFIPVTEYSSKKRAKVMNIWLYYANADHPDMFNGKVLAIVNSATEGYTASGMPYGSESGHAYKNLPWIIRSKYILPYEVFCIENYDARYYTILRLGLEHDVTTIATMNPLTILILFQKIERHAKDIIKDINDGTLKESFYITEDIREKIEKTLKPNPARAKELEGMLAQSGALMPKDFWPNLALIDCWKGGTVGIFIDELLKYFPAKTKVRDFGYLSTEARCSIPRWDEGHAGILTIDSNFYEFVIEEDIKKEKQQYLTVSELEKDKQYCIYLTTPSGLYRYNIADIIRVVGLYNKTPLIEFIQKAQNVSSVTGEKLYESHVIDAMNKARETTGLDMEFFCCCLERKIPPHYSFLIEFIGEPTHSQKKGFLMSMEDNLSRVNIEYKLKRLSQRLDCPKLVVLEKGSFEKFHKSKLQFSRHDGQFKYSLLKADFKTPEEFTIKEIIQYK
ncbi:MAG: GH3 auxin-responsive promoter family protein [Candidatus Omnitrophota bacterium]